MAAWANQRRRSRGWPSAVSPYVADAPNRPAVRGLRESPTPSGPQKEVLISGWLHGLIHMGLIRGLDAN